MGNAPVKDRTAQGVAKVRHYESLHASERRLYYDPYAHSMYPGSFVQSWLGEGVTHWLYELFGTQGLLEMLSIRTRWIDEQVVAAAAPQLVILGAGYDTRGFRLDLPPDDSGIVFEVDQPDVQAKKVAIMEKLAKSNADVAKRMESSFVKFVPVDFNVDSIDERLKSAEGYSVNKQTIVIFEGVTQYIPKASTADTLTKLKRVVAPGSKLLITYLDQNVFDEPKRVGPPQVVEKITSLVAGGGEPWISGWTRDGFKSFLQDMGYEIVSDTTASNYNDEYLVPLDRGQKPEEMLSMERFVVATVKA